MPSFAELNIFNQIIKLPEFKVKDYQFIEGFGLVLVVENIEKKATCPHCGEKSDRATSKSLLCSKRFASSRTPCILKSKSKTI